VLHRLLLLPLLTPLLAVLLLGAINPRPWVALQLLTWRSPALPLGAWIGAAAAAGAGLSAAATGLALQAGAAAAGTPPGRRQVRRSRSDNRNDSDHDEAPIWPEPGPPEPMAQDRTAEASGGWGGWAGPSRAPADPPPTVAVPFRVIRRGGKAAPEPVAQASNTAASTAAEAPAASSAGTAVVVGDGWDSQPSEAW